MIVQICGWWQLQWSVNKTPFPFNRFKYFCRNMNLTIESATYKINYIKFFNKHFPYNSYYLMEF